MLLRITLPVLLAGCVLEIDSAGSEVTKAHLVRLSTRRPCRANSTCDLGVATLAKIARHRVLLGTHDAIRRAKYVHHGKSFIKKQTCVLSENYAKRGHPILKATTDVGLILPNAGELKRLARAGARTISLGKLTGSTSGVRTNQGSFKLRNSRYWSRREEIKPDKNLYRPGEPTLRNGKLVAQFSRTYTRHLKLPFVKNNRGYLFTRLDGRRRAWLTRVVCTTKGNCLQLGRRAFNTKKTEDRCDYFEDNSTIGDQEAH